MRQKKIIRKGSAPASYPGETRLAIRNGARFFGKPGYRAVSKTRKFAKKYQILEKN
jgi:hypothetical protein